MPVRLYNSSVPLQTTKIGNYMNDIADTTYDDLPPRLRIVDHKGKDAVILFETFAEQQKYAKQEAIFCKQEYIACQSAFSLKQREHRKELLNRKRLLFATDMGMRPTRQNKTVWLYDKKKERKK